MYRVRAFIRTVRLFILGVLIHPLAMALPITIDPGAYTGTYSVPGSGALSGVNVVDLSPGSYNLLFTGAAGNRIPIVVDSAGNVTTTNTAAASTSGSTLSLNTTQITIDPAGYGGTYRIAAAANARVSGEKPFTLVRNVSSWTVLFSSAPENRFLIDVDAAGNVTSQNLPAASAAGSQLTFNSTSMTVDPGSYTGTYFVDSAAQSSRSGASTFSVVPNTGNWVFQFSTAPGNRFTYDVSASGELSSDNTVAATASGSTLSLNSTNVTIDPGAYSGTYFIQGANNASISGVNPIMVVPGIDSWQVLFSTAPLNRFGFNVGASGDVTSQNTAAATGLGNTLNFSTVAIQIDPQTFTGASRIVAAEIGSVVGVRDVELVPNIGNWFIQISPTSNGLFSLSDTGIPEPDTVPINVSGTIHDFRLSRAAIVNPNPTCQEAKDAIVAAGIASASDVVLSHADGELIATGGNISNSNGDDCFFLSSDADKLQSDSRHGNNDEGAHIDTIIGMSVGDSLSFRIDGGFFADFIFENGNNRALVPYYDLFYLAEFLNNPSRVSGDLSSAVYNSDVNAMTYVIDDSPNTNGDEITLVAWNIGDLTRARPIVPTPPFVDSPTTLEDVRLSIVLTGQFNAFDLFPSNSDNVITAVGAALSNNDGDDLIIMSANPDQLRFDSRHGDNDEGEHVDVIAGMDDSDSLTFRIDGGFFSDSAFQNGNANQGRVAFCQLTSFANFLNDASRVDEDESEAVFLSAINSTLFVIDDSPGADGDEISFIVWNEGDLTN